MGGRQGSSSGLCFLDHNDEDNDHDDEGRRPGWAAPVLVSAAGPLGSPQDWRLSRACWAPAAALPLLTRGLVAGMPCSCPPGRRLVVLYPGDPGPSRTPRTLILWPPECKAQCTPSPQSPPDSAQRTGATQSAAAWGVLGHEGLRTHSRWRPQQRPRPWPLPGRKAFGHPPFTTESAPQSDRHGKWPRNESLKVEADAHATPRISRCPSP